MSKYNLKSVVDSLFNGKKPAENYCSGEASELLAAALSDRIDAGVAPSLCAHAMCCSAAAGNVAVVRMLSSRPMSTFNKAYTFGEPLRRACRAFIKAVQVHDLLRQRALVECARLLVIANGSLDQPDKYLKSGLSAAGSLKASGTSEALALLDSLVALKSLTLCVKEGIPTKTGPGAAASEKMVVKGKNRGQVKPSEYPRQAAGKKRKLECTESFLSDGDSSAHITSSS